MLFPSKEHCIYCRSQVSNTKVSITATERFVEMKNSLFTEFVAGGKVINTDEIGEVVN